MINLKNEKRKMSLSGASSEKQKESSLILRKAKFQAIFKFVLSSASGGAGGGKYNRISAFVSMPVLLIRRSLEKIFKKIFRDDSFTFGCAKVLAFALLISFNLSPSFAADCVPETTIINGVEKPLVECGSYIMLKYTYDSSGNKTNESRYKNGLKYHEDIYTYDSSGNLESKVFYSCGSDNCEQRSESKYKLGTTPDGKIAKEIYYGCSNGVCEKNTESETIYDYEGNTFSYDNVINDNEYFCGEDGYECDTEFPQSISATPFCPKGCNGCDVERACSSCAEGYKKIDTWCNKIRWTPAEAAAVLNDDNNTVTLTFRK